MENINKNNLVRACLLFETSENTFKNLIEIEHDLAKSLQNSI